MKNIIIFASGSGTNAENIAKYFSKTDKATVSMILTNNQKAGVIEKAQKMNISCICFSKKDFFETDKILNLLKKEADFIALAGFLWKVPKNIIEAFPNKILNIHPALLPKYGGKGMYGMNVHKAVVANKETESGITIHYVNENYDEGAIVFQEKIAVSPKDTPESVAAKIHTLEYENFPKIIEKCLNE